MEVLNIHRWVAKRQKRSDYVNTGWIYREIITSTNRSRIGVIGKCVALGINGKTWDKRVLKINIA